MAGTLCSTTCQDEPGPRDELCILLVGDLERGEFEPCAELLESASTVLGVTDPSAAAELLAEHGLAPDVLILLQAFPGQFSFAQLDRLRRLAPLAPIVMLLGTWCEGEMRSGHPLPGTIRVYWHQWHASAPRQLARLRTAQNCAWALPPTAAPEERLLGDVGHGPGLPSCLVALCTPRFESADWLAAVCRAAGCPSVWIRPSRPAWVEGVGLVLFDGTDFTGPELERLCELSRRLPDVPVIALADFPRIEDRERILRAGAAAVLSKPADSEDLLWTMGRLAGR